jgi:hypothetical protein
MEFNGNNWKLLNQIKILPQVTMPNTDKYNVEQTKVSPHRQDAGSYG